MKKTNDLTGQIFGRLTVIERSEMSDPYTGRLWKCQCSCGNVAYVSTGRLTTGNNRSCGCLARELKKGNPEKRRGKPNQKKIMHEPKTDCIMYRCGIKPDCIGLTEMLCVTKGKCSFYKTGGNHED